MDPVKFFKTEPSALWKALVLCLLVVGCLTIADRLSVNLILHGWQRMVDDLLGGLIAGCIFYLYEVRRLRRLRKQLQVIDLMNHHIRNALQPLLFVDYKERTKMKLIEVSVDHIDWALREVLTGKSQEHFRSRGTSGHVAPRAFFSSWLDAWRRRNHKVTGLEKAPSSID